jgi:hypothetical protein
LSANEYRLKGPKEGSNGRGAILKGVIIKKSFPMSLSCKQIINKDYIGYSSRTAPSQQWVFVRFRRIALLSKLETANSLLP